MATRWTARPFSTSSKLFAYPRRRLVRYQTTSTSLSSSPSAKITSVPFRINPQDALQRLHIAALVSTVKFSNMIYAALLRFLGPGVTYFAKELGMGEEVKLKDMRAALYPIWRCDVLIEGKVMNVFSKEKVESKGVVGVHGGYVPGNPFAPLSYLSYATQRIPDGLSAYDPSTDHSQLGEGYDVVPIPFTVSPLGLIKKIRSIVGTRREWHGLTLEEEKWKEVMVACYPIMFPIYIAEFEFRKAEDDARSFTLVIDAHDDSGSPRVSTPTPPEVFGRGELGKNYYVNPHAFLPEAHFLLPMTLSEDPTSSSSSEGELHLPPGAEKIIEAYQYFMSPEPSSLTSIKPSPMLEVESEEGGVDWSDPRIQRWNEERDGNGHWLKRVLATETQLGFIHTLEGKTDKTEDGDDAMVRTFEINLNQKPAMKTTMKPIAEIRQEASRDEERLRNELEENKPEWLKRLER